MKRMILSLSMLLMMTASFAQNDKYQKGMEQSIAMFDSAKSIEDFTSSAARFERIGDAEQKEWLPYYYAALSNILRGFQDQKADKDEIANKADALLTKAEAIDSKNSEIALLKSMSAVLHMMVDPMNRWQQYGTMQREALENAKQYDETNPRIYLFEGQSTMNTPPQFGGGKDKAKPMFEKSLTLYKTFKPASSLHPKWGEKQAQQMLEMCK